MSQREALLGVSSAEFRDIAVSPCKVQKPGQRFGDGAAETMKARGEIELHNMTNPHAEISSSDSDPDSEDEAGSARGPRSASKPTRRKPPKLQNWRMNLTALSQVYNLYFAAYCNKIWVYCPVGPMAQGLGGKPALVIAHAMSPVGARIPPRIAGWKGDEANHMIVGFLGDAEILLLCYENGDVAAYYTREIAAHIARRAQYPDSVPRPHPRSFFNANVGDTAWGLAIHSKSRLIAVSTNRPEVTVFAFALTRAPAPGRSLAPPHSPFEAAVLARKRNWRIVLPLKQEGGNIPNIDFVSSSLGHAQKVLAVDIGGHIWLLDIWRQETAPALVVPQDSTWGLSDRQLSWAVVALPESSFLDLGTRRHNASKAYFSGEASHTRAIALGNGSIPIQLPFRNSRYWIDTTGALSLIQDSKFTGRTQSYPLSNLPNPSQLTANTPPFTTATLTAASSGEDEEGAEASSGTENDDHEDGDDSDDEGDEDFQPDSGENELDEGEYEEDDLEVEVSSWGEEDDDDDDINDPPFPAINVAAINSWTGGPIPLNSGPPPPFLESYLPNDTDQPHVQFSASLSNVHQPTHAQEAIGIVSKRLVPGLAADRLPRDATEQREEYVDGQPAPRMGMIYSPHKGMTYCEPVSDRTWFSWLRRRKEVNMASTEQNQAEIAAVGEHTSFFVTDDANLRLLTTNRRFVDIFCRGPAGVNLYPGYTGPRRLNMTLHVPELNLIIAACQSGRVALVSLIKSPWALPTVCGDRSMRVDKILPTASEEEQRKLRPRVPLFGIAMGPVQEVEDRTLRLRPRKAPSSFSCMYRLVLHFRDHSILSYTVSRPSPDDLRVI